IPEIDSAETPESRIALGMACVAARHQSRGSCSAQPGSGLANGSCSAVPEERMRPLSSTRIARVPPVPTSMPRKWIHAPFFFFQPAANLLRVTTRESQALAHRVAFQLRGIYRQSALFVRLGFERLSLE